MRFTLTTFAAIAILCVGQTYAATASSIGACPALKPRATAATSVADLRPDDIKVVAALGDSIMAGFAAEGIQGTNIINIKSLYEYRGVSYGGGGDPGADTVPNYFKRYNPSIKGASVDEHLVEICYGIICPPFQYKPLKDVLNAAQSAAMAQNLDSQLDYLITAMKLTPGVNFKNDWKFINLQIGSNDQCASCIDTVFPLLTPEKYGQHVTAAVERIRKNIPRVIVNLIGTFNVTEVYSVTADQDYCKPFQNTDFIINQIECPCAIAKEYRPKMDEVSAGYTKQLAAIAQKFKALQTDSFGVIYSPANIKVDTFPVQGLSNIDCFHPSTLGHAYVAKSLWNTLFVPLAHKPKTMTWNSTLELYCPNEADRFQLD
ncbi:hypothetical protein HMPREF1544_05461 [Mucor circinelloides 1006PhL]|uniref:SGNH hydrolase-type esterase domain-containing protein n=1 Tax=Mucor circinelloides f. circinelloides (strain 1006PhL) TaxID=1220926 RepID=S2K637_MUCC1|nr:hypothetical protein HMPREF1544_05461 [Mucor circinelloides 1006PhL]KAG1094805.1 hypothetical protein G6F42_018683 [Rhizopus arrhizus]